MDAKIVLAGVLVLGSLGFAGFTMLQRPSVAPDFQLYSTRAKLVHLEDLRGKVVVLDFWASWCPPCRMAIPRLEEVHQAAKDRGVVVLGINVHDDKDPAQTMATLGATYTCLVNGDAVSHDYGVKGIPTIMVISPDGEVLFRESGWGSQSQINILKAIEKGLASAQP